MKSTEQEWGAWIPTLHGAHPLGVLVKMLCGVASRGFPLAVKRSLRASLAWALSASNSHEAQCPSHLTAPPRKRNLENLDAGDEYKEKGHVK